MTSPGRSLMNKKNKVCQRIEAWWIPTLIQNEVQRRLFDTNVFTRFDKKVLIKSKKPTITLVKTVKC